MTLLAQQNPSADPITVVALVAVLIIVVVGAGLVVMHIRGRLLRKQDDRSTTESWLDELRAMHRRGEVSDAEFQAARNSLLARVTGQPVPRPATPSPGSRSDGRSDGSVRVAAPGFDLTGAPLPGPGGPIGERPGGRRSAGNHPSDPDGPPAASPSPDR